MSVEFTTEPGRHPGYTNHFFEAQGRRWRLTVVDTEDEKTSIIQAQNLPNEVQWRGYDHLTIKGIITPDSAAFIIYRVYAAYSYGHSAGVKKQQDMARQVFGI